jgi:hypothetical protein
MRREQIYGPVFPNEYDRLRRFVAFRFWWVRQWADDIALEFIEFFSRRGGDLAAADNFRKFLRAHPLDLKNIVRKYNAQGVHIPLDALGFEIADRLAAGVTNMLEWQMSLSSAINHLPKDYRIGLEAWAKTGYNRKLAVEALVGSGFCETHTAAYQLLTRARQQLVANLKSGR